MIVAGEGGGLKQRGAGLAAGTPGNKHFQLLSPCLILVCPFSQIDSNALVGDEMVHEREVERS